jgi:hypothetical protein
MNAMVFLSDGDLAETRRRVRERPWAAALLERLRAPHAFAAIAAAGDFPDAPTPDEGNWLRDQALACAIAGDDTPVPAIVAALERRFFTRTMDQPLPRHLTESWGICLSHGRHFWAYDLVRNHPLAADARDRFESRFREILSAKLRIQAGYVVPPNNTGLWDVAIGVICAFLVGDLSAAERLIHGPFGLREGLDSLSDGQVWHEPLVYSQGYLATCLLLAAELCRVRGCGDLYGYRSARGCSIRSMADGWLRFLLADGRYALSGDGSETARTAPPAPLPDRPAGAACPFAVPDAKFELLHRAYRGPEYAWMLARDPQRAAFDGLFWGYAALTHGEDLGEQRPLDAASVVLPEYGSAVLRSDETASYWGSNAPAVLLRQGNYMIHGHNDHFAIALHAFGRSLYPDIFRSWDYCGGLFADGRNQTPLTPSILGHNTVIVDRHEPDVHNNLEPWHCAEPYDVAFSPLRRCGAMQLLSLQGVAYANVWQQRTIGLCQEYVAERFRLRAGAVRLFDYVLHGFHSLRVEGLDGVESYDDFAVDYSLAPVDSQAAGPHNVWLAAGTRAPGSGPVRAVFREPDGVGVAAYVIGGAPTIVFQSSTPSLIQTPRGIQDPAAAQAPRLPVLILRRRALQTDFVVVHQPFRGEPAPLQVDLRDGMLTVTGPSFTDTICFDSSSFTRHSPRRVARFTSSPVS